MSSNIRLERNSFVQITISFEHSKFLITISTDLLNYILLLKINDENLNLKKFIRQCYRDRILNVSDPFSLIPISTLLRI